MPPSPALRYSPSRKMESHKRGRSFESGLMFREKDDDLALFNDMNSRERDNFLIPCRNEDFDDSISMKLKYFSDFKLGVTIPARADGSGLLNADGEKNDYDWLLTPPDTPLFPSLDDETIPPPNLSQRGRPRSQPISISRSNTMEKSYSSRASRTSASPHRLSPSPRSTSSMVQSRGRPSSAPNSSFIRPSTPSRRPSTPPGKPSNQAPRASTPTSRRMSTGSSGYPSSSGRRGPSPVNTNRGSSSSPKLSAWQSSLPGFSSDAPPNLRTSLGDRPASYVRGSSPASRNGRDTSGHRRQSPSPTVSRSSSSLHHQYHDQFSSHIKSSVGSSFDEEVESVQSTLPAKHEVFPGNSGHSNKKVLAFPKRVSHPISSGSAPKRSFDSAMRQIDHRKNHQNMFRPLLSSVPSTSFYVGKGSTFHQRMVSMNSSVTTSSNASSEQGASVVPDTDGSDHENDVLDGEWERAPFSDVREEMLSYEEAEQLGKNKPDMELHIVDSERIGDVLHSEADSSILATLDEAEALASERLTNSEIDELNAGVAVLDGSVAGSYGDLVVICSKCGRKFLMLENMDENLNICQSCIKQNKLLACQLQLLAMPSNTTTEVQMIERNSEAVSSNDGREQNEMDTDVEIDYQLSNDPQCQDAPENDHGQEEREHGSSCLLVLDEEMENFAVDNLETKSESKDITEFQDNSEELKSIESMQSQGSLSHINKSLPVKEGIAHPSLTVEVAEGAGISLLLSRSSSGNWPVVHGKSLAVSSITSDNPSFFTNSLNATRGLSNASSSSSTETASTRQISARFQRQSSRRSDLESPRTDTHAELQLQHVGPISPRAPAIALEAEVHSVSSNQENLESSLVTMEGGVLEDNTMVHGEKSMALEHVQSEKVSYISVQATRQEYDQLDVKDKQMLPVDSSTAETSSDFDHAQLEIEFDTSDAKILDESCKLVKNCRLLETPEICYPNCSQYIPEKDQSLQDIESFGPMDSDTIGSNTVQVEVVDAVAEDCSVNVSGDQENGHDNITRSRSDSAVLPSAEGILDQEPSPYAAEEAGSSHNIPELEILDHTLCSKDEEVTKVEGPKGCLSRNITLEEATDTVLFCSSIVHSLAHKAASIAMEKEESSLCLEGARPTVTILGNSGLKDARKPSVSSGRRTQRLQRPRTKQRSQKNDSSPLVKTEAVKVRETKIDHSTVPNQPDSMKPPKLESKCNCSVM
ncbi:hypothetical protein EJ110_NYTH03515 [Nymphaea thermarum]|nr:hypothetical protein EJ110_NYTH03515 [Nymphaea thermarum]